MLHILKHTNTNIDLDLPPNTYQIWQGGESSFTFSDSKIEGQQYNGQLKDYYTKNIELFYI